MTRYAAFLRGVMPTNARMPDLERAFEAAGFSEVRTLLGSGNVLFSAARAKEATLESRAEAAMERELGRTFFTIVRPVDMLRALLERDPYRRFRLTTDAKRVVTFLRTTPDPGLKLPAEKEGARILALEGREAFTAYERGPKTPVFMTLIEMAFGKEQTTRTWETVAKAAR